MKNNTYNLENVSFFRYTIVLYISFFVSGQAAFAADLKTLPSRVVGTVKDREPSWYAIIKVGREKKLYTKGDIFCSDIDITHSFRIQDIKEDALILRDLDTERTVTVTIGHDIPIKGTEMIFEKTVQADVIEYRYTEPERHVKGTPKKGFSVTDFSKRKVVLGRDYIRPEIEGGLSEQEKELFDSPMIRDNKAQKVKASLFKEIEFKKIGEDVWEVNTKKAEPAVANAGRAILTMIKEVRPRYRFGEGPSLAFSSELGDVVINKQGFLIKNLALAALASRAGIKKGDLVKSVNDYPVNSLYGLYKAYMLVKSDREVKIVKVDIIRDGRPQTLIYKIR